MCNEKTKKGNKGTLAVLLSIAALVLCLLVFVLWIFETIPHSVVTPDSFIGACITLLSIIVTIAIGWQIFNVVEVKNTMKELKERQERVDELHDELKVELLNVKTEGEDMKHSTYHLHAMTLALHYEKERRYDIAIIQCLTALAECMQLKDPLNTNFILDRFMQYIKSQQSNISVTHFVKNEITALDNLIRNSKNYHYIARRYEPLYGEFINKLVIAENELYS